MLLLCFSPSGKVVIVRVHWASIGVFGVPLYGVRILSGIVISFFSILA